MCFEACRTEAHLEKSILRKKHQSKQALSCDVALLRPLKNKRGSIVSEGWGYPIRMLIKGSPYDGLNFLEVDLAYKVHLSNLNLIKKEGVQSMIFCDGTKNNEMIKIP